MTASGSVKGRLHTVIVGPTVGPTVGGLSTFYDRWTNGWSNRLEGLSTLRDCLTNRWSESS
jgi:hypothetical protein